MIWIALLALGFYVIVCWSLAGSYISPGHSDPGPHPPGTQEVTFDSNNLKVPAWATANVESAPVVYVLAHGYGGTRAAWADEMAFLAKAGFGAVAPAMPGQDLSPEPRVGFGVDEARTIVDAVKWVRAHHTAPVKIVLMGVSMGGAATWLASGLDPSVDAVITEGAYADFPSAMDQFFNRALPGGSVLLRPVVWFATLRSGLRPATIRPVLAAQKWRGRPALIIQAGNDRLILRHHADELAAASGAELWVVPGADHANCESADPAGYEKRVIAVGARLVEGP